MTDATAKLLAANPKPTFAWFKQLIAERGYTKAQLRCDVAPGPDLLDLMDRIGLSRYESWITRLGLND